MKRSASVGVLMLMVMVMLVGCVTPGTPSTETVQITQRDTATWMNSIYNAQYADYLTWFVKDATGKTVIKPGTPEAQKDVLVMKKQIFAELQPLLITYSTYVATGVAPSGTVIADVEARAIQLVNALIMTGGK